MNFPRDEKRHESTNTGSQTECSKSCTRESETATDLLKDSFGLLSEEGSPAHAQLGSTFELPTKRDTLASPTSERGDAADHEPSTPNECSTNVVGIDKQQNERRNGVVEAGEDRGGEETRTIEMLLSLDILDRWGKMADESNLQGGGRASVPAGG